MPVAQLLHGGIDRDHAVITSDFSSVELDSGQTHSFNKAARKFLIISALSDIYAAFTSDGTTPNAAVSPRVRIQAGSSFPVAIRDGVKVTVLSA